MMCYCIKPATVRTLLFLREELAAQTIDFGRSFLRLVFRRDGITRFVALETI